LASPINSISGRMIAITIVWTLLSLSVTGLTLSTIFKRIAEESFQELLLAHAYNLMGAIDVDKNGVLQGAPNLGDPRFVAPLSGWYWAVAKVDNPKRAILHSRSLSSNELNFAPSIEVPFDSNFRRTYSKNGTQHLDAQLFVGEGDDLFQVTIAADRTGLAQDISNFQISLFSFLGLFGVGTVLATYLLIKIGLRPLKQATQKLNDVRHSGAKRIDGEYPEEVSPLVHEINALIEANAGVIERSRTQVGNLAHALKTPLAVIMNESRSKKIAEANLIEDQAAVMQGQIQTYLDRARIAANVDVIASRTSISDVITSLANVLHKLHRHVEFRNSVDENALFFGERQDLEEVLGNLLENAAKYANSVVNISVHQEASSNSESLISLVVEDDGPGVDAEQKKTMIQRGVRLDEKISGSGLGLSIVGDIAKEYKGAMELEDSPLGGLRVVVSLPGKLR